MSNAGKFAAETFNDEYKELLLSFDQAQVRQALLAWADVDGASHYERGLNGVEGLGMILQMGFLELLDRGAIQPIRPYSTRGEKLLEIMRRITPRPRKEPQQQQAAVADPIDQFVAAYPSMSADELKHRYTSDPEFKALMDRASAEGRI